MSIDHRLRTIRCKLMQVFILRNENQQSEVPYLRQEMDKTSV